MIKCGADVYIRKETDLWAADIKVDSLPEGKPEYVWKGEKIPVNVLHQFVAFARWAHGEHKCEVQSRIMYDPDTKTYHNLVYPQRGSAASTNEVADHKDRDKACLEVPKGAFQIGTIHSHPGFSAFQSGTDKSDSAKQDGIHITVGWTNDDVHQLSLEATAYGNRYPSQAAGWFCLDPKLGWAKHPQPIQDAALEYWILRMAAGTTFPESWKERVVKEYAVTTYTAISSPRTTYGLWGYEGQGAYPESRASTTRYRANSKILPHNVEKDLNFLIGTIDRECDFDANTSPIDLIEETISILEEWKENLERETDEAEWKRLELDDQKEGLSND